MLAVLEFLKGRRVLYVVPTGDQITRFWYEVCIMLAEPIEFGVFKKKEGEKIIELPGTEQRIRAKTAWNAATLRGDFADLLIFDEYQLMNEDAWATVGAPMLVDNNGDALFIYTPPRLHSKDVSKAVDKMHAAKMFKAHVDDPRWLCLHFTSYDNPNISEEGLSEVSLDMTALAKKQELMAEDVDEVPGALWTLKLIDRNRVPAIPPEALPLARIVVGLDPTGSSTNEAGIVAAGLGRNGHGYLIEDASLLAPSSATWGKQTVWCFVQHAADRVVVETNYGGDMCRGVLEAVDPNVPIREVVASRGKAVRAEPIAALYEKGMIHHVGDDKQYVKLEEEMCSYIPILSKVSPNRMDALVWAFTDLFPENQRLALIEQAMANTLQKENIAKVATNEKTEHCPKCDWHGVARRGQSFICSRCGEQWGPNIVIKYDSGARGPRSGL